MSSLFTSIDITPDTGYDDANNMVLSDFPVILTCLLSTEILLLVKCMLNGAGNLNFIICSYLSHIPHVVFVRSGLAKTEKHGGVGRIEEGKRQYLH